MVCRFRHGTRVAVQRARRGTGATFRRCKTRLVQWAQRREPSPVPARGAVPRGISLQVTRRDRRRRPGRAAGAAADTLAPRSPGSGLQRARAPAVVRHYRTRRVQRRCPNGHKDAPWRFVQFAVSPAVASQPIRCDIACAQVMIARTWPETLGLVPQHRPWVAVRRFDQGPPDGPGQCGYAGGAHAVQAASRATRSAAARMLSTVPAYTAGVKPADRHISTVN